MCRWFAYISPSEPCLLEDVLIAPKHSLSKQVHDRYLPYLTHHDPKDPHAQQEIAARNVRYNMEGMGVAWYTLASEEFTKHCHGPRPAMYKTISPPLTDFNFATLCANISTKTCFAHIRAATSAVAQSQCHPFIFGRHSFMHNGMISNFVDIKRELCQKMDKDSYKNVHGSSDTEHLAALYMTVLTGGRGEASWQEEYTTLEMAHALHEAVGTVIDLQKQILGSRAVPNSLNLATTDGVRMVAYRFRNHKVEAPPSLYYSTKAGVTLNRKYPDNADGHQNPGARHDTEEHGKHIIIASEPSTYKEEDWVLIDKNACVRVESDGTWEMSDIPYDAHWDAEDPDGTIVDL